MCISAYHQEHIVETKTIIGTCVYSLCSWYFLQHKGNKPTNIKRMKKTRPPSCQTLDIMRYWNHTSSTICPKSMLNYIALESSFALDKCSYLKIDPKEDCTQQQSTSCNLLISCCHDYGKLEAPNGGTIPAALKRLLYHQATVIYECTFLVFALKMDMVQVKAWIKFYCEKNCCDDKVTKVVLIHSHLIMSYSPFIALFITFRLYFLSRTHLQYDN